jgi:hypothetical protein
MGKLHIALLPISWLLVISFLLFTPLSTKANTREHIHADNFKAARIEPVFNVSPVIDEVSASVFDSENGLVWTLGDSGTGARIGRTHVETGETIPIDITGAVNQDWEAMVMDEAGLLWILDVGDNSAVREYVTFYQADPLDLTDNNTLPVIRTITVTYQDGPMNVEAAVYDEGLIYIIEKTPLREIAPYKARVVTVDVSETADPEQEAESAGTIPIYQSITDASVSPEGYLYLLTYTGIYVSIDWREFDRHAMPFKFFFYGQQEALVALGNNSFYVGVELGIEPGAFYYTKKWFPPPAVR